MPDIYLKWIRSAPGRYTADAGRFGQFRIKRHRDQDRWINSQLEAGGQISWPLGNFRLLGQAKDDCGRELHRLIVRDPRTLQEHMTRLVHGDGTGLQLLASRMFHSGNRTFALQAARRQEQGLGGKVLPLRAYELFVALQGLNGPAHLLALLDAASESPDELPLLADALVDLDRGREAEALRTLAEALR